MDCGCGKPNTNAENKDFTKAVIEINNPESLVLLRKVVIPTSMGDEESIPPAVGKYNNVVLYYESSENVYLYSSDGIPTRLTGDLTQIKDRLDSLEEYSVTETTEREAADDDLQEQIDTIKAASDVVDIVGTYAELLAYDTSGLSQNDIIRVLSDESHDGATSYYRWSNGTWVFIGDMGPFYTQSELDQMFADEEGAREQADNVLSSRIDSLSSSLSAEARAREEADTALQNNITAEATARQNADAGLSADIVAEANARSQADAELEQAWQSEATTRGTADQALQTAIDNEASARAAGDLTNTQAINAEVANRVAADNTLQGNIDALSTVVDGKQNELTAGTGIDITNNVISVTNAGPTVVQTTGTSTTDVMSQNAVTSMVFADPATKQKITIGASQNNGSYGTAIGYQSQIVSGDRAVAIGYRAEAHANGAVAIGAGSNATSVGEVNIGSSSTGYGYNNSNYRLLTGLYDPQNDHDAATKGYVDSAVPTKTSDLTNDSDFQTSTDVATAVSAVETKLNDSVMTELTMATDATKVEFTETKKNLSTGTTSTEVDTIPLASTTQAGILNAAGYQSIIDSQDRLDALAGGAVSIANLSANPSQSDLTTAWQTATGETTVFNRASIFDSTNGKNWTYFDNTSAWEVTGTVNQSITINNFSQGTAGLIVGDNMAGKVYAEQDGTGSVYGWDALNTRVTNVESATANIPSVVQTAGTSATDVMSQNAVTSMVFADPANKKRINIGLGANASSGSTDGVAIGSYAVTNDAHGVAIGAEAGAYAPGSIALGYGSTASTKGVVSFESIYFTACYNNTRYRLLTGLYDGQSDHDAVTVGQLNTAIAGVSGAEEISSADWSALWQ